MTAHRRRPGGGRVLVTGGTGFIGRHALDPLVERGFNVHAVTSRQLPTRPGAAVYHRADLHDPSGLAAVVGRIAPTHLLHFAWAMVPGHTAPAGEQLQWTATTLHLLRAFAAGGGTRAVIAGSCAEYDWRHGYCVEGVTPCVPSSVYGACKNAAQAAVEAFAGEAGLSVAWGRIFFVYGPHEPMPRLVPELVSSLIRGEVARCSHGEQIRDYLHVEDVARAFVALLESDVHGAVNVGSGQPVRVREIANHVASRLHAAHLLALGARRSPAGDPPMLVADVRRLVEEVGWQPRHTLASGLDATIAWWQRQLGQVDHVECRA